MKNVSSIDLLFMKYTSPNLHVRLRAIRTEAVYAILQDADTPLSAREIFDKFGEKDAWGEAHLSDGTWVNIGHVVHTLRRFIAAGIVSSNGVREVWYNVNENTKKRGEVRLYSLNR